MLGEIRAYHVPLIQQYGLGLTSPPAALCPCIPTIQGNNQLHYHFGSGLSATLACSALTTFISDSRYINHTIQVRLPNRIVACSLSLSPRSFSLNPFGTDRDHIILSAEQSLRNLATDHLDLLLIHRPDPLMDADEVAEAFLALHHSGKVRHFGVSNFTPAQFTLLQSRLPFTLATNQVELSPAHQPLLLDGTLDQLQQLRIRPMAWSCLGGGRLFNDESFQPLRDELAQIAQELNAESIEQVVYAWVLRLPSKPLPIIGSGKIERVRSAIVAEKLHMTRQQWFRIRKAALGYDVP